VAPPLRRAGASPRRRPRRGCRPPARECAPTRKGEALDQGGRVRVRGLVLTVGILCAALTLTVGVLCVGFSKSYTKNSVCGQQRGCSRVRTIHEIKIVNSGYWRNGYFKFVTLLELVSSTFFFVSS